MAALAEIVADLNKPDMRLVQKFGDALVQFPHRFVFYHHVDALLGSEWRTSQDHFAGVVAVGTPDDLQSLDETFWTVWAGSIIHEVRRGDQYTRGALINAFHTNVKDVEKQTHAAAYLWNYGGHESGRRQALKLLMPLLQPEVSELEQRQFIQSVADAVVHMGDEENAAALLSWYTFEKGTHVIFQPNSPDSRLTDSQARAAGATG